MGQDDREGHGGRDSKNDKAKSKEMSCPVCGSERRERVGKYRFRENLFSGSWLDKCRDCTCVYNVNMPSQSSLDDYYTGPRYWDKSEPEKNPTHRVQAESRVRFIEKNRGLREGMRILDIGAGYGMMGRAIRKEVNAMIFGTESNEKARAYLNQKQSPYQLISSSVHLTWGPFDLIILSHILEHFRETKRWMEALRCYCHDRTKLFIEVPNQDHLFKEYHDPHLIFFNPKSLRILLNKAGFKVIKMRECGLTPDEYRDKVYGWEEKLRSFIPFKRYMKKTVQDYGFNKYGKGRIWIRCLAGR